MKSFDLATVSLEPGTTLIEASAGTGKTYSITGLIIRLLLEKDIKISEIVAVTFTEAATAELRDRARARIAAALDDLRSGYSDDPALSTILLSGETVSAAQKLNLALQSFDEAQIFTIHGFCQRCLNDYAFESGARFDTNLTADPQSLFDEVARDFWRLRFYEAKHLLVALALVREQSPKSWATLLQRATRHPDLVIIPPSENLSSDELLARVEEAFAAVRREWQEHGAEIERLLRDDPGLSRAKASFHAGRVADIVSQLTLACENFDCAAPECIGALAHVCTEAIEAGTKGSKIPPVHRFFSLCTAFCKSVTALFTQLTHEFLLFARSELPRRKARANTITYDDLITGLRDSLRGRQGSRLAEVIGKKYKAALIDEFQDTDPAQYQIFNAVFGQKRHCLFYIGDPKQSIYGFRGADVFTYREAAQAVKSNAFTLTTNWRSEPALLAGFNALFHQSKAPFLFDWITYHAVHVPPNPKVVPLTGDLGHPLRLRLLKTAQGDKNFTQDAATELISKQVTADITELNALGAMLGNRPLHHRDKAVLVRTNIQAGIIQESLRAGGIRSVLRTDTSVFASMEAEELQRFLLAVLEPRRDGLVKGALATSLFGFDAHRLYELETDEEERQCWINRFCDWQQQWINGCFIAMFRGFLVGQSVRARLVKLPSGERRLTNYLQLAELLHNTETTQRLSPDAVCAFLSEERSNAKTAQEEYQLRLESDEDAVQIITTHKAKGLEFPVVFCPFLWKPAESKTHQDLQFHDRDHDDCLTFDLREKGGGDDRHVEWQSEEVQSEELRLAYVAMTRAMNRCYVYVAESQSILQSPLAHLLGATTELSIVNQIETLVGESSDSIQVKLIDPVLTPQTFSNDLKPAAKEARRFKGKLSDLAMTASFSGLNSEVELGRPSESRPWQERTENTAELPAIIGDSTIFTFPKGPQVGDFFHDVLEHIEFDAPDEIDALVRKKLRSHGFVDPDYSPVVGSVLRDLLEIELAPGVCLRAVNKTDKLAEVEFTYPLRFLTPPDLHEILASAGLDPAVSERMSRLQFRPVQGYMRGFIDLLFRCQDRFYLIDWKSNWLGGTDSDYDQPALAAGMLEHNYYLQYHLYTLAADLFLKSRLVDYNYQRDFGGVFYVFLRGIDRNNPQQGIFRDKPSERTLSSLHKLVP